MVYVEDCLKTLHRDIRYDYVLCSPPDYDELKLDPKSNEWNTWLASWVSLLAPVNNLVTICISDRKSGGEIHSKHINVIETMKLNAWFLKSHKIWVKTLKANLYRFSYMHILTFARKPHKTNSVKAFYPDVILDEAPTIYRKFKYGMSLKVCSYLILNHTKENDTVYDPFMGSGTTAVASVQTHRNYLGSEINPAYAELIKQRLTR
mgnify:CR=1 FL=1